VLVTTYPEGVKFTGSTYTDVNSTIYDCQLSLPYSVAACILDRQLDVAQYTAERLADPAIHELASRVKVIPNEEMTRDYPRDWPVEINIRLRDGTNLKQRVDQVWGSPVRPMTDAELTDKFERLVTLLVDGDAAREAASRLLKVEAEESLTGIIELLACTDPFGT
jgi:2-methylcitrate dehydratase PrpD